MASNRKRNITGPYGLPGIPLPASVEPSCNPFGIFTRGPRPRGRGAGQRLRAQAPGCHIRSSSVRSPALLRCFRCTAWSPAGSAILKFQNPTSEPDRTSRSPPAGFSAPHIQQHHSFFEKEYDQLEYLEKSVEFYCTRMGDKNQFHILDYEEKYVFHGVFPGTPYTVFDWEG